MAMGGPDDAAPRRPRWLGGVIVFGMALVVLGMFNVGWRIARPAPAAGAALGGKALVQGGDCMRCHGFERQYVGPAFRQIADRYRGRADAADYLARKIREGGGSEWGRALMPRHPHVTQEQALQMAGWILSLSPQAAAE